jgi:hypothetical protein
MAAPLRHDGYGKPLPELADARQEVLLERPFNRQMRQAIRHAMDAKDALHCRRGTYVRVTIHYEIHDGMLQGDWSLTTEELHKVTRED